MIQNDKPKTHRVTCVNCGADIEFNSDDVLKKWDETKAFREMYSKSVRCPYCGERNIIEHRDINGTITKAKVERI